MARCDKLLQKAKTAPHSLRFEELCALAKCFGWALTRQNGSHHVYVNPDLTTVQGRRKVFNTWRNGMAAEYQVTDLLDSIEGLT